MPEDLSTPTKSVKQLKTMRKKLATGKASKKTARR